jgi:hypothetical protein
MSGQRQASRRLLLDACDDLLAVRSVQSTVSALHSLASLQLSIARYTVIALLRERVDSSFGSTYYDLDIRGGVSAWHRYGRLVVGHSDSADGHHKTRCVYNYNWVGASTTVSTKAGAISHCRYKRYVGIQQCALLLYNRSVA